jgi:signal transduction histidine kinase
MRKNAITPNSDNKITHIDEKFEKLKENFLSATSHELKTPLTSQKAFIQILDQMVTQNNDQQYKRYIKKISEQNEKLSQLVNSLLDANKIKDGRLLYTPTKFDMNLLIKEIITDLKQTTNRTITVASSVKKSIQTDKGKMDQVISNLIINAIKYSPHSSEILINIKEKNNSMIVSIQDFGIGIDIGNFEDIFKPFYRITGHRERTFPGLGMGLYISNEIIKHLGGRMWLESTKGKGSTFFFSIPFT